MWQIKAGIALAILAALGFVLWRNEVLTKKLNASRSETALERFKVDAATKTIETMKADAALNKETSHALAERLAVIDGSRSTFSVRCHPLRLPTSTAESGAPAGDDASPERRGPEAPLRDIGTALEDARIEAQRNNARQVALQQWELARTH